MNKKLVAFTLSLILVVSLSVTAFAATNASEKSSDNYEYISELAAKTKVLTDDELKNSLVEVTLDYIRNTEIKLELSEELYDFNNSQVALLDDSETSTVLTVPVQDDAYGVFTNLTVVFDQSNQLLTYSELILTKSEKNTYAIQIFNDGIEMYNEITDLEYISNSEMNEWISDVQTEYSEPQTYGLNIPCFVAVSGAGASVSGLIVKLCGAPCVLAPPTCAVCLGGIIVIGGGGIIAAVTQCWE